MSSPRQEKYPAGTLAMANAGPDTNGSQFFIVFADSRLPPAYAVFGTVYARRARSCRRSPPRESTAAAPTARPPRR